MDPSSPAVKKVAKKKKNFCKDSSVAGVFILDTLRLSITAPQDAHKRLVMQIAEWLTTSLYQCSREVSDMS